MDNWVPATAENTPSGAPVRIRTWHKENGNLFEVTVMGKVTEYTAGSVWLPILIETVASNPPGCGSLFHPGEALLVRLNKCQVLGEQASALAPAPPAFSERELNFQLVQIRRADDLRNQIQRARREGRALDVFCMELELGDYRT